MDALINTRLFTVSNILAIGAIVFFWACVAYTLQDVWTKQS